MVGVFERVFEIAPAFRAELSATTRHVSEVTMLDVEMGFVDHDDIMNFLQDLLFTVTTRLYEERAAELKSLNAPELVLTKEFPRYTMAEIHELYQKGTGTDVSKRDRSYSR